MSVEYRYRLVRRVSDLPQLFPVRWLFCALNPSTATETEDDPTVRRMQGFAWRAGATEMHLVNLYAARSTDPTGLWRMDDPVGPENDMHIDLEAAQADVIIAAWGALTSWGATGSVARRLAQQREQRVLDILTRRGNVYRMGKPTKHGHPRHPLYLPKDTQLVLHRARVL